MDQGIANAAGSEIIQEIIAEVGKAEQIRHGPLDDDEAVFVLGETGSGKSTTISLLLGERLTAVKDGSNLVISALNPGQGSYPSIGNGILSETSFPTRWRDTNEKISYWDLPGFDDVSGPTHDIPQAYYIKTALSLYKRIKLLILAPSKVFSGRAGDFLKLIEYLVPLIGEAKELEESLYLIVSKADSQTSSKDILSFINKVLQIFPNLSEKQTKIIKALCNESDITILHKPQKEGSLYQIASHAIISNLKKLKSFSPVSINISLPAGSINLMNDLAFNFSASAKSKVLAIIEACHQRIQKEIISVANYTALRNTLDLFTKLVEKITNTTIVKEFLKNVKHMITFLIPDRHSLGEELARDLHFLIFCQEVGSKIEFDSSFWCLKFKEFSANLKLLISVDTQYSDIEKKVTAKGVVLSLKQILSELGKLEGIEEMEIICVNTLFLDQNLILPGVSLSIIAPTWKVKKSITINLSGKVGRSPSLPHAESNSVNGKPGFAGQNGGDFTGIGKNFINMKKLMIKLDGGKGEKGGNGKDGKDGKKGSDGDRDKVDNRHDSVLKKRVKAEWKDGELRCAFEAVCTFSDTFYNEYESQGTKGEDGGSAGMGGCGGYGGYHGRLHFVTEGDDGSWPKISMENGPQGDDGLPGIPGKGGEGGITHRGVYQEVKTLPKLRGYSEDAGFGGTTSTACAIAETSTTMLKSANSELAKTAAKAGQGALSLGTFAKSLGIGLLIQGAVSGVYELVARGNWSESVKSKKEDNGKDGVVPNEKNREGLTNPVQKCDGVDIQKLSHLYNNCLITYNGKMDKEIYCVDMSEIFSKILV